jgi:hypothetical protein
MEKSINAYLKGSLVKGPGKKRVEKGDLVLLEKDPSTTETNKYIIIWKYSEEEKKKLTKLGELKTISVTSEASGGGSANIQFEGDANKKEEEEVNVEDL